MRKRGWSWFGIAACGAAFLTACGDHSSTQKPRAACPEQAESTPATATHEAALDASDGARIFLSGDLLARLVARAQGGDAAWTELQKQCDAQAAATVHPPSGAAYPGPTGIGQGYQGEDYLPAITSVSLCYRVSKAFDAASAERYAAAGVRILDAMSTPASSGGFSPSINHGYGIRNYGVGMAIGYDWLHPVLSAATRDRVQKALGVWFDWYDANGFSRNHPIGNYFAGYFQAKTLAALALEGDDPKAGTYWADVSSRLWGTLVKPMYSAYLDGGGWPEGWGYGPRAVRGIAEVLWAVKTAKNLDWHADVPQVHDQAAYVSYFAWPSLSRMDDHGTVRANIPMQPSAVLTTALATILGELGDPSAPKARAFAEDVIKTAADDRKPWEKFLYWDASLPAESYKSRPLSYLAKGPGNVAMRSSWEGDAAWGSFSGGAYINAPESGEQTFNSGALTVVNGGSPVLVNATGWIPFTAHTAGEDFVYQDTWGKGGRRLYNMFYVDDASNPFNPGQSLVDPTKSSAHIAEYEEAGAHVFARASGLEDQYGGTEPIKQLNRDVVFLRPASFVVFDRSHVASATADQWLAFHVPSAPVSGSADDASQRRLDVVSGGATVGSVRTLLPKNAALQTVALPGGTHRIEVHAPERKAEERWLSVVTASADVPKHELLSVADGNVIDGDVVGVLLHTQKNQVALFSSSGAALPRFEYSVAQSADAHHVLVDVAPSTSGYDVGTAVTGDRLIVTVEAGGPFQVSEAGTLAFEVTKSGTVSAPPPPPASEDPTTGGASGSDDPCAAVAPSGCPGSSAGQAASGNTDGNEEDLSAGSERACP